MVKDLVCDMMVDPEKTKFKTEYNGHNYYFCAKVCQIEFEKNPSKYANDRGFFVGYLEWSRDTYKFGDQ